MATSTRKNIAQFIKEPNSIFPVILNQHVYRFILSMDYIGVDIKDLLVSHAYNARFDGHTWRIRDPVNNKAEIIPKTKLTILDYAVAIR